MSTNEYIREFEFIEHPGSPNKHNSSCSSSTIVKMWVLLEGSPDSEELKADITHVTNLHDFKDVLIKEFDDVLKNTKRRNIVLLNNNAPIPPDAKLQTLANNTATTPLVVRYPISSANLKIAYKFGNHKLHECELPHNSGSFNLLKEAVIEKHSGLGDFYFVYEIVKGEERQIQNQYNLNTLISECKLNGNNYVISTLKVVEKGKKSFSAWKLNDVFSEILQNNYTSLKEFPRLDMKEFDPLEREFDEEELKHFVWELKRNLEAFDEEVSTNEMTSRTYINTFITTAVKHVRKVQNKKSLRLSLETDLNGTRGSGPLDYAVMLGTILLLLVEAKSADMNQGIAQAIVQLYTLMEKLFQKFEKPIVYGIVTTGISWRFFRWTGSSLNEPEIHFSKEFICDLDIDDNDMKGAKRILRYIAQILQEQVNTYYKEDSEDSKRPSKRTKI